MAALDINNIEMSVKFIGDNFDYLFKLVVIGDSGVGKTNLLSRFATNQFSQQSKPTIGVQFATKTMKIQQKGIKVQIWDTAGQQKFRSITHAYYKGASGSLLVFDLTRRSTFENITRWLKELKDNAEDDIVCILVGNKCDLADSRAIKEDEIAQFVQQHKLFYLETSALDSQNVEKAFMSVIEEIYKQVGKGKKNVSRKKPQMKTDIGNGSVKLKEKERRGGEKKKCCQ